MSQYSFYRRTKVADSTHDVNPGSQLPTAHPFVAPQTQESDPSPTPEQIARMHQLDVGMMRTLNLQAKLAIGEPDDKYEQEADAIAAQVVEQINAPSAQQPSLQREELREEDELQMKPVTQTLQRQEMPLEE